MGGRSKAMKVARLLYMLYTMLFTPLLGSLLLSTHMRNVILCCLFMCYLIRYPWFSCLSHINLLFGRLALSAFRLCLAGLEPAPPTTAPALPIQLSYRHNLWIKKVLSYGTVLFQYTRQDSNLHHGPPNQRFAS